MPPAGAGPNSGGNANIAKALKNLFNKIEELCTPDDPPNPCAKRWDKEYKTCDKWTGFGQRWVRACQDRANIRLRLCNRNGGTFDPDEPDEWTPDRG